MVWCSGVTTSTDLSISSRVNMRPSLLASNSASDPLGYVYTPTDTIYLCSTADVPELLCVLLVLRDLIYPCNPQKAVYSKHISSLKLTALLLTFPLHSDCSEDMRLNTIALV